MGPYVPILVLTIFVLTSRGSSASLRQLFYNTTRNCSQNEVQLHLIYNVSNELLQQQISTHKAAEAEQLRHILGMVHWNGTTTNIIRAVRASLGHLRNLAERDAIIAILGRRLILACIVLHREAFGKHVSEQETELFFADVAKELYGIHVKSVLRKALLDYLHISKSGGTSFSKAARLSKCKMFPGIGQPIYIGDLPHWLDRLTFGEMTGGMKMTWSLYGRIDRGNVSGCEKRIANVTARGVQYLSNEYTLHGGTGGMAGVHVCRQAINVVTLREPGARLVSHMHFLLAHVKIRLARSRGKTSEVDFFHSAFCTSNVSMWEKLATPIMDNYNVRSFIGERAFHTPLGGIGQQHLDVARRLLLQFDLVLDLDAGEAASDLLMYQGLGWNVTLAEVHARTADLVSMKAKYNRSECGNEELLAAVIPRQGPDRELYRMGQMLSLLDQLLLGWARHIGLQPEPGAAEGVVAADTSAAARDALRKRRCGLFDRSSLRADSDAEEENEKEEEKEETEEST